MFILIKACFPKINNSIWTTTIFWKKNNYHFVVNPLIKLKAVSSMFRGKRKWSKPSYIYHIRWSINWQKIEFLYYWFYSAYKKLQKKHFQSVLHSRLLWIIFRMTESLINLGNYRLEFRNFTEKVIHHLCFLEKAQGPSGCFSLFLFTKKIIMRLTKQTYALEVSQISIFVHNAS